MAFAFVRGSGTSSNVAGATIAQAYAANVTAANLLVCAVSWSSTSLTATVADDVNGAWTRIDLSLASGGVSGWNSQLFYRPNAGAGATTVTATISGSVTSRLLDILEYSGGATVTPFDTANGGTGATTSASLPLTTTQSNDLVVAHLLASGTGNNGVGYVERVSTSGNETEDRVDAGAAGAINVLASDTGGGWNMATAAFSLTDIGGGTPVALPSGPRRFPLGV